MLQAMVLAEGSLVRRDFNQTEGPVLEAFEILATLAGYKLTGGHSVPSGWSDKIRRRYRLSKKREQIKPQVVEAGRGDTWCPTVAYGSVIAKQGQQITITGNTTPQHEAAVVSGSLMSTGAVWVRSAWLDHSGSSDLWRAEAVRCSRDYGATFARVDRSQSSELDRIKSAGFWDAASGNAHVEVRLAEFQSLVMKRAIFFDLAGPGVQAYYDHLCAYHRDREGKIVEEQDDDVDAGCYLVSELVRPTAEFAPPVARPVYKTDPRPVPYRGANVRNKVRGGAA
jgi:hypothetical protein